MKVKVSGLIPAITALSAIVFSASAQDELPVPETQDAAHHEMNLSEDKATNYDRSTHNQMIKDSLQTAPRIVPGSMNKPAHPDASRNNSKEPDEDALSFNFLYYFIQKFKMADLIDQ